MLSMNNKTSWLRSSRKYSVIAKRGERDAQTRARRLVHLPVNQRDFRFAQILLIDDARFAHFLVEIVAFTRSLADAGEDGKAAVAFRDVVDQLEDDDGLADARAAERADFSALGKRADQVDDFDAGLENRGRCPDRSARAPCDGSGNASCK